MVICDGELQGDITKANNFGCTPMYVACDQGHLRVCEWLYNMGAKEDITKADNDDGWTPMHVACENGHI